MKKLILVLALFSSALWSHATHNRAGEITYSHISGLTYEVKVTLFADPNSPAISRREIEIDWGDNTGRDSLNVSPNTIDVIPGLVIKRFWIARHTFPGPGSYKISVTDPNRNGGVDNIENSSAVPFYVESLLRISPLGGIYNNSVELRNDPIDDACVGQTFVHNPGAVDVDGDSLAYSISPSLGLSGNVAPGYTFPPASTAIYVNALTGDLVWENPTQSGLYNIAIVIKEYRNGVLLGSVLRDLQILVYAGCTNYPPTIAINSNYCVEAGKSLQIPVRGFDQDLGDRVSLSFSGEIFENFIPNKANVNLGPVGNPSNASILWNTICDNIRIQSYTVSVKATDNAQLRGEVNLSSFRNSEIRVIGPAPINFSASPIQKEIQLNWDISACTNATGYRLYRRNGSTGFVPDSCQIGVPEELGYTFINKINDPSINQFIDNDNGNGLVPGLQYCYLITALFPDGDEGYASQEVCASVLKFVPVITEVSVKKTDPAAGQIQLSWSRPDTLDDINYLPPFRYLIYKKLNGTTTLMDSTLDVLDTTYVDSTINTLDLSHQYSIEMISLGPTRKSVGKSSFASSIFLSLQGKDNAMELKWAEEVPWINDTYTIYRKSPTDLTFDSVGISSSSSFTDNNLSNGATYCYYVRSKGKYNLASLPFDLFNNSQIACAEPEDNEAPCSPIMELTADCFKDDIFIKWSNPNHTCGDGNDVILYQLYQAESKNGEWELIKSIGDLLDSSYSANLQSVAGCYVVTAVDSSGNESSKSNYLCVEYCPSYELPNIFTPNGDGVNDFFVPIKNPKYKYVKSIDLKVYNRWGQIVFQTKNPDINWDGTHFKKNQMLPDGVYYYSCLVNELSLEGTNQRIIKGLVNIQDAKPNNLK